MGELAIGYIGLPAGFGHAFVRITTEFEGREIHGNAGNETTWPTGLFSAAVDSIPIVVEERSPEDTNLRLRNIITLATGIPDSTLTDVFDGVLSDAQNHFEGAEYQFPRVSYQETISGIRTTFVGIDIVIVPDIQIDVTLLPADRRYWDV